MLATLLLYLSIGAMPAWMIPLHVICHRLLGTLHLQPSVQVSALVTAMIANALYGTLLFSLSSTFWSTSGIDVIAGVVFVGVTVNAMALFYFQLVNVALTSIHMAVLLRISWAGTLPLDKLLSGYDREYMLGERIQRLVQLHQMTFDGRTLRLRSHALIALSAPIYLWRRILQLSSET